MKVRFFGFTLEAASKHLTMDQWAAHLHGNRPDIHAVEQGQRLLLLDNESHQHYRLGLVVTVKDQRRFCQLVNEGGEVRVRVSEIEAGAGMMDFNFFVVNKLTGAGMYQHYHQSCSVPTFGGLVCKSFGEFKKASIELAFDALPAEEQTQKKRDALARRHAGRLLWTQLIRQEALQALIAELARVKAFEYVLSTPEVPEEEFRPLAAHIRTRTSRIGFSAGTPKQLVAESIANFVRAGEAKSGRIEGEDEDGSPRYLSILNNPDNFGEYEYDDVADQLNELDLGAFHQSWVIQELLRSCREHSHIIEVPRAP